MAVRVVPVGPVMLAIRTTPVVSGDPRRGPDTVSLGIEGADGTFTALAALDGRYLSTEVAGDFTGRPIGMYAATGTVPFAWFDYQPIEEPPGGEQAQMKAPSACPRTRRAARCRRCA